MTNEEKSIISNLVFALVCLLLVMGIVVGIYKKNLDLVCQDMGYDEMLKRATPPNGVTPRRIVRLCIRIEEPAILRLDQDAIRAQPDDEITVIK